MDTNETQAVELGVKFTSTASGFIKGIRFYKGVNNTGTHVGNLWSSTGTLLASATFASETASGWQQVNFSSPVAISANAVYIASYFSPTGDFSVDRSYFATAGVNNPPLQALVDGGAGGANAVYAYGSKSQFPTTSYSSSNYWVDVVFSPSSQSTIWPSTAIPGTLDTNETQAVELGVKFTSSVSGLINGIRFYKGVNNTGTHVGNLWSSTGTLLASATFASETASGWQQVNFSSPVAISANAVYIASYFSPTGDFSVDRSYFATVGVNNPPLQALVNGGAGGANAVYAYGSKSQFPTTSYSSSNYWVDVVFSPPTSSSSQGTIWPSTATPGTLDTNETQQVELGVKFTSSVSGLINGIRFYKGVNNTGTHVGNLWSSTGTLLASATFANETASGWQQANFSSPVAISANTVYVVSYFSPTGDFSVDRSYFATGGVNNPPLQAPVDGGAGGANAVYAYASKSQFPTSSYSSSNYWVDVVFSGGTTVTPVTITTSSLAGGTQGTAYSQSLTAAGGTSPYIWTLVSGTNLPAGLILSSAGVISGTPTGSGTTNFTVKVTDSSSPAQTAQASLSITVTASNPPPNCPCSIWPNATTPVMPDSFDSQAVELGVKFTSSSNGYITGIRFYKGVSNTGTHVGNLWNSNGTLLMSATFTGETSSGWQQVNFSNPVAITANTVYIVSYFSPTGDFAVDRNYFTTTGVNNPPLQALVNGGAAGVDGVYAYASKSQFPTTSYQSSNYWVDVVFNTVGTGATTAVSLSPKRGGVTVNQSLPLTATVVNDVGSAGVNWSVSSGGTLSNQSTTSATFKAATAGVYTVTATSNANPGVSASITIGVTDLAGVFTYHDDASRDGSNPSEYALTTSNVTAGSFGKLFSCTVDGAIYAQPLWVANLSIGGVTRNVVFVATQHDSLYAFDADNNATPCTPLWHVSLIDSAHGGGSQETSVPSGVSGSPLGQGGSGGGDIVAEVGVTGTPVIDPSTKKLYVVSKSWIASSQTFFQRLHAIDLITGNETSGSPVPIAGTYPGTGDGGSTVTFNARQENQRPGLALVNGIVYIAWASHEDFPPYYGWVMGYSASTLTRSFVLNVTPNVGYGGIWMGGGAPAVDSSNNLYLITGNGNFDVTSTSGPTNDYGDSFLKLSSNLTVSGYFTPSDQDSDNSSDRDFGSGGAAVLVNQTTGPVQHLVIGGGKDGYLYSLNRDAMGGFGDSNAWQRFNFGFPIFATGAFWNNTLYLAGVNGPVQAYSFNPSTSKFNTPSSSQSSSSFGFPGSTPSVSSSGATNGIVWALNNSSFCTTLASSCGPAVLHAFDATNLALELWNSNQVSGNAAGNAVKFTIPTVANGKAYVGTRGNNTGGTFGSTSISGELDVFGLLPN